MPDCSKPSGPVSALWLSMRPSKNWCALEATASSAAAAERGRPRPRERERGVGAEAGPQRT